MRSEGDRVVNVDASTPKACPSCGARYPADALFCSFDGAPLTTSPGAIAAAAATDHYLGREILGHIEIRQLVGFGAMGRVYRAFQKGIDRDVAVKVLHRELSANQTLVARFQREAKVASRLAHPNVVHVLLTGQLPDSALYIVMEYLDGLSLQSALAGSGGPMPLPRALHIALQLCDAAGEAHAQGIVHRDLKPENVMLVRRADNPDFVKVLDFGIARLNWADQSMSTAAGLIFGTARYISPEGAQGDKVAPQGDVYAIATMVYQMLAGRTPFDGDQAVALLVQQIHDPPPELKSFARASYVPDPIAAVVMQNLAKKPEDRAENARAFGRALLEAAVASGLSAQDILARPVMLGGPRGPEASVVQMTSMQRTKQLELDPALAARMGAEPSGPTKTAYMEPARSAGEGRAPVRTEIAEPEAPRPGTATTKWASSPEFEAKVAAGPPSSVDATMDDDKQLQAARTLPIAKAPTPPPLSRVDTAPPRSRTPGPTSKPPSSVETTMAGEESPARASRAKARSLLLVIACFLVGAVGMATVAYRAGRLGTARSHTATPTLEAQVARANDALLHRRWDAPPGDNVRDLTDEGLALWPKDAQLVHIRELACDDVVKAARSKHETGDAPEALRLVKLASQLDPSDPDAIELSAAWSTPQVPMAGTSVPPLAGARSAAGATTGAAGMGAPRVVIDVSNSKPGVGQPVDFSARLAAGASAASRAKVDGARFFIAGPGIATGTQLDATDDGSGVFRSTFTFLQGGRFEVSFGARADGSPVRGARLVVVGDPRQVPPVPGAAGAVVPAPTGSTKWL